jgi:hypothetical protein
VAALGAVPGLARAISAAAAGKASGALRRAAAEAHRARILRLWEASNPRLSASERARQVRRKLGARAPSVKTILRVVKSAGE